MRIGIIGSGCIGGTLGRLLARAGHEVRLCNSRGPDSLRELVAEIGVNARATSKEEAVRGTDVVVLAAPWRVTDALPAADTVAGKIVVDAMNPYSGDGAQIDLGSTTPSEETAKRLPRARLVKAFNTIWFKHLAEAGRPDLPMMQRRAIPLAGDDPQAKRVVASLISAIGFAPVDTGGLRRGGMWQAVNSRLYNREVTGSQALSIVATTSRGHEFGRLAPPPRRVGEEAGG